MPFPTLGGHGNVDPTTFVLGPEEAELAATAIRLLRRRCGTTSPVDLFIGAEKRGVLEIMPVRA